jgi:drug/metabolite transporter (DMT)-like permease
MAAEAIRAGALPSGWLPFFCRAEDDGPGALTAVWRHGRYPPPHEPQPPIRMSPLYLGLCLVFSLSLAVGQVLFKLAAGQFGQAITLDALLSPYLIGALVLYAATTVLWIFILRAVPLSSAYPFSLLGAVLVIGVAALLLKEPVTVRQLVGAGVVVAGMLVIYL